MMTCTFNVWPAQALGCLSFSVQMASCNFPFSPEDLQPN